MSDALATLTAAVPMARVVEREARVWQRYWFKSVLTGVLMPVLFLLALGVGLGGMVDRNDADLGGLDYLVFVAPGILAASGVQYAAGSCLWPVMAGTKWIRWFHGAAATPLAPVQVFEGYVAWVAVRALINAVLFALVAAALGAIVSPWGVLAPFAAAFGALAVAAPLAAYAAAQDSDMPFPLIFRLLVMPMFLFSGTFFPIDQLPAALQVLAVLSPMWHAVELCRGATTGTLGAGPAAVHVAYLTAWVVVGRWYGSRTFAATLAP
jgi:lipooligosaccharide transport system permease protein